MLASVFSLLAFGCYLFACLFDCSLVLVAAVGGLLSLDVVVAVVVDGSW